MKKSIVFLISILVCSLSLLAQEKRDTIHSVTRNSAVTAKQKRNSIMDTLDLTKYQKELSKILSPKQLARYKELQKQRKDKADGLMLDEDN